MKNEELRMKNFCDLKRIFLQSVYQYVEKVKKVESLSSLTLYLL